MRSKLILAASVAAFSVFATAASAAKVFYCSESGQGWIITGDANGGTAVPAGGCLDGPYFVVLEARVAGGGGGGPKHNRYEELALTVLDKMPQGPLKWQPEDPKMAAAVAKLQPAGKLGSGEIPKWIAAQLWPAR